ncbi:MAG TPA: 2-oxoacid:acceptor oxidoreductase family protein [Dissulfurispiraceae bacterium]|nr:2-oxoacid:acceptor oxidoreductase family protein [Dissulfurispiraceae bacterium]
MEQRIVIAGNGGQGILLAGRLLALAAVTEEKEVTWFPCYGAEMRSGNAHCTVIISDRIIGAPLVRTFDCCIAMSDSGYRRFAPHIRSGGVLIYDSGLIQAAASEHIRPFGIDALRLAAAEGTPRSANMVMVGALAALGSLVRLDTLQSALKTLLGRGNTARLDKNLALMEKGYSNHADTSR